MQTESREIASDTEFTRSTGAAHNHRHCSPSRRFIVSARGGTRRRKRRATGACTRRKEQQLLSTVLAAMNRREHQFVAPLLHDRIVRALELCCRRDAVDSEPARRPNLRLICLEAAAV
jgi:hypothetical protein